VQETRIDVEVPKISTNLGNDLHFVKLPNFLSIESRPFDAKDYEEEIEDDDTLDEEGRARLKLKIENTIRWRIGYDEEGHTKRESNAKMVRWSDGSYSLHLGSEIFDVSKQTLQQTKDDNHLFIRQGTGLQGQAVFRTKLSFRPSSTDSFTHQKMTRSMADRTNKATGIKVISTVGRDPEAGRFKRVKEEEERLRMDLRRDSMKKRVKERATANRLSQGYLEGGDSDDEGGVSLNALKNKYKKGGNKRGEKKQDYSASDDDDSDIETRKARKLEMAKKKTIKDSDDESGESTRSRSPAQRSRSRSRSRSASSARSKSGSDAGSKKSGSGSDSD